MLDWLNEHILYWHWIVFGIVLAAMEIFAPSFFMLLMGAAAVLVGVTLLFFDLSFTAQLGIWVGLSVTEMYLWFRIIQPKIKTRSLSGMALESLIGETGMVLSFNSEKHKGNLRFIVPKLGRDEWGFRSDQDLSEGDRVRIKAVVGNELFVEKCN